MPTGALTSAQKDKVGRQRFTQNNHDDGLPKKHLKCSGQQGQKVNISTSWGHGGGHEGAGVCPSG